MQFAEFYFNNDPSGVATSCRPFHDHQKSRSPSVLRVVRHDQSAGNVAHDAADLASNHHIPLNIRDVDVPLSALGCGQAEALDRWFASGHEDGRSEIMLSSLSLELTPITGCVPTYAWRETTALIRVNCV
jgi:hypothetical protein